MLQSSIIVPKSDRSPSLLSAVLRSTSLLVAAGALLLTPACQESSPVIVTVASPSAAFADLTFETQTTTDEDEIATLILVRCDDDICPKTYFDFADDNIGTLVAELSSDALEQNLLSGTVRYPDDFEELGAIDDFSLAPDERAALEEGQLYAALGYVISPAAGPLLLGNEFTEFRAGE